MQHIITILIAILIFGLIIGIHEFGHFIVAKLNQIQVNQFAIGMGPKLIHFQKGETEYSVPCKARISTVTILTILKKKQSGVE